jgi:hypothetical protein
MTMTATGLQWLIRVIGLVEIVLGALFWTNNSLSLIPLHMLLGIILVLALWILAGLGLRAQAPIGLVAGAFVWGLITAVFGMLQDGILPGDLHWIIRVLHLLIGLGAIGIAESLARRIHMPRTKRMAASPA